MLIKRKSRKRRTDKQRQGQGWLFSDGILFISSIFFPNYFALTFAVHLQTETQWKHYNLQTHSTKHTACTLSPCDSITSCSWNTSPQNNSFIHDCSSGGGGCGGRLLRRKICTVASRSWLLACRSLQLAADNIVHVLNCTVVRMICRYTEKRKDVVPLG